MVTDETNYYNIKTLIMRRELKCRDAKVVFETYVVVKNGKVTIEEYDTGKLVKTFNLANIKNKVVNP